MFLDGSVVDFVPCLVMASWCLGILPHLLAEGVRGHSHRGVSPCLRLLILLIAMSSFIPLTLVSFCCEDGFFLYLPVWANFYGLIELSNSTSTTLDKPAVLNDPC